MALCAVLALIWSWASPNAARGQAGGSGGSGGSGGAGEASGAGEDWPSFQGGPAHLGAAPAETLSPPLKRTWVIAAPGGDARLSAAAVAGGVAVATGRNSVVGFDPASGRQLWTVTRAPSPLIPPAMDTALGSHGLVLYLEGNSKATSALVAIDLSNRSQRWRLALGDLAQGAPTIQGGMAFVGARDQFVYAVDATSGALRWKVRTEGVVDTSPAVDGGKAYVVSESTAATRSRVYALDTESGHVDWTYAPPGRALNDSSVTVANGRVFVGLGDATVRALNATTGALVWSAPVRGDFSASSSLAVAGGSVYVQDREGGVYRLNAETGSLLWDFQLMSIADSAAPLVAGTSLFVGLDDGTVAALNVGSGHLEWRTQLRFGAIGPLTPAGELLLVPSIGPGGGIVAFRPTAGPLLDVHSPTELDLPIALARYAAAFVVMLAAVLGLFNVLGRRVAREAAGGPSPGEQAGSGEEALPDESADMAPGDDGGEAGWDG